MTFTAAELIKINKIIADLQKARIEREFKKWQEDSLKAYEEWIKENENS